VTPSQDAAERLALIDPATGAVLSRLHTWLAIAVMVSGAAFVSLVVTAVSPVMHEISEHFGQGGYGKMVAYGIAILPSIGIMIGGPITGWAIERIGSRRFLLSILIVFALSGSAGLYLEDVRLLAATRFVLGVAAAGIVTCTLIMIGEYFEAGMRARILGYQSAVASVAALLIILGSGELADWAGWRAPFALYLFAIPAFAAAAIAVPKRPAGVQRARAMAEAGAWRALIALWPALAIFVALFIGSFMPTLQVSFLLAANGVLKPFNQSLVLAASALMVSAGAAIYGPVRSRLSSDRATLRLCGVLIGAGIVVMGLSHEAIQVAVGCGISGVGTGLLNPQVNNMLIARAGPHARGPAVGLGYTARYTGDFLNPVIVGPLAVAIGLHGAMLVVGIAFVAAAGVDLARRLTAASA
jgi:MFS family permease